MSYRHVLQKVWVGLRLWQNSWAATILHAALLHTLLVLPLIYGCVGSASRQFIVVNVRCVWSTEISRSNHPDQEHVQAQIVVLDWCGCGDMLVTWPDWLMDRLLIIAFPFVLVWENSCLEGVPHPHHPPTHQNWNSGIWVLCCHGSNGWVGRLLQPHSGM